VTEPVIPLGDGVGVGLGIPVGLADADAEADGEGDGEITSSFLQPTARPRHMAKSIGYSFMFLLLASPDSQLATNEYYGRFTMSERRATVLNR
jgi:hypothetical protein